MQDFKQTENISDIADDELVDMVSGTAIGTTSGLSAQNAQAELMRRNTEALIESKKSADKSSDRMLGLTLILGLVAFLQLIFSIISSNTTSIEKIVYAVGVLALVVFAFYDYFVVEKD